VSGRRCRTETWHMLRSSRLRSGEVTSGPARCGQPASQTGNCAAEAPTCDAHLVLAPADAAWKNAPSHECLATRAGLVCRRPAQRGHLPPGAFYVCRVSRVSEVAANETRAADRHRPRRVVSGRRCRTETWHMLRSSRLRSGEVTSGPARCGQPASQAENCAAGAATRVGAVSPLPSGKALGPTDCWLRCGKPPADAATVSPPSQAQFSRRRPRRRTSRDLAAAALRFGTRRTRSGFAVHDAYSNE
jgi:hypothetical protein